MGLDMYLYAEVKPLKDSELHKVIEANLSERHRVAMDDPEDGYAYISGWSHEKNPDPLYEALCAQMRLTPHHGSPHFDLFPARDGSYRVAPCIYYWRKANAIHQWFVDFAQDGADACQRTLVHPEMLADLVDRCERVDADHSLAGKLLPTQSGFFFGSTDYDEWYFAIVRETAAGLRKAVAAAPKPAAFYYQSSW
jgi:hypothetical protein